MKLTGENRTTRGKTCPIATLSTTNPTWTDPGSNPGLRGERSAKRTYLDGSITNSYYQSLQVKVSVLNVAHLPRN
jgi:hypothetical protein